MVMCMNIVFLDIDGVLNSQNKLMEVYYKTGKPHSGINYPFDEKCLENLKILIEETNSKIVITSTWRKYEEDMKKLINIFKEYNLDKRIIGYTPVLNTKREEEIIEYLKELDTNVNFVIIDDITDMGTLNEKLVVTSYKTGLTNEIVSSAIKILKKG